jgi:hypothetical protein
LVDATGKELNMGTSFRFFGIEVIIYPNVSMEVKKIEFLSEHL